MEIAPNPGCQIIASEHNIARIPKAIYHPQSFVPNLRKSVEYPQIVKPLNRSQKATINGISSILTNG